MCYVLEDRIFLGFLTKKTVIKKSKIQNSGMEEKRVPISPER